MTYTTPETFIATATDEEVEHILGTSLIKTDLPGRETLKYSVDGHPGLFIRKYGGSEVEGEEIKQANSAVRAMERYGIAVPPSRFHSNVTGNYLLTVYIQGATLTECLNNDPLGHFISRTDEHFARIGAWLLGEAQEDRDTVMDVFDSDQYMHGVAGTNPAADIWLADLPGYAAHDDSYAFNTLHLAHGILDAEHRSNARLPSARLALMRAAEFAPEITNDTEGYISKIHHALDTNTIPSLE